MSSEKKKNDQVFQTMSAQKTQTDKQQGGSEDLKVREWE